MNEFKSSLQKLGDSNYPVWKFRMELVLIQEGLQAVVNDPKPDEADAAWTANDAKARALIGLSIEDSQLCHVIRAGSAKDMWDALKKYHERSSLSSKVHVLRKLCSQRLLERGSMSDHLNEVTALTNRLTAMGEELKEHLVVAMLFSSLPESYGSLVTALESRPEEDLTLEFVKGKLLDEWRRREERQAAEKVLRINNGETTEPSSARPKVTCHYCNKEGHYRRDCKKLARDSKAVDQKKPKQKVKLVTTGEACLAASNVASKGTWVLDSGATSHMTNEMALLETLDTSRQESITVADGKQIKANGVGEGTFQGVNGEGNPMNIKLSQVYHVPGLAGNLLSVSKITDQGYSVLFDRTSCKIQKNGVTHILGERRGNLYQLKKRAENLLLTTDNHPKQCVHLWHRRLGHRCIEAIKQAVREGLCSGISMQECDVKTVCGTCYEGKMARLPFPKASETRSEAVGDLIHTDLAGPFEVTTPSGIRYSMVMVDDFSRYTVLYLLRCKSEAYEKIQQYVSLIENQFGRKPKIIRADGGGEYSSEKLKKYLADNGILLQQTAPYSPQQNGIAERKNRSLGEMMRCLLSEANLQKKFWGEAISTANHLQNILPTKASSATPYELWHGRKPSYTHLRVFGSTAWVFIPSQKRRKLDRKAEKLVLVGYAEGRKAYRLLNPENCTITISRDVKFDESFQAGSSMKTGDDLKEMEVNIRLNAPTIESIVGSIDAMDGDDADSVILEDEFQDSPEQRTEEDRVSVPAPDGNVASAIPNDDALQTPRRSQRPTKGIPPRRLFLCAGNDELVEPKTFAEAIASTDHEKWRSAMKEELQSIDDNDTWELVDLPTGRKPVGSKWVYKIKRGAQAEVTRFKARLVAQGYSQQFGTDYDQVFAPVVRQTTFRTLLAVAAKQGMLVRQYDVKTAFLYGTLEEEIYLRQPPGFVVRGQENKVYRLKKSLYGLKQAARAWNHKLHTVLLRMGFQRCDADPCL